MSHEYINIPPLPPSPPVHKTSFKDIYENRVDEAR